MQSDNGLSAKTTEIRTRDGVRLFHRDWGQGQSMVFVHSWAMSSDMWAYQVAHLSEQGFRCIAYDRRGHGRSDAVSRGFDIDTLADDLAAVIEGLALENVILVGHSMGGGEIVRYLGRHGTARVAKVVLLAPVTPCILQKPDNAYGAPMAYYEAVRETWRTDFPKWIEDNKAPFFTPETSPRMIEWLVDQMLDTPVPVAIATNKAMVDADLRRDLAEIDRPMLILHGDVDASAPVDLTGRRTAEAVRGARLKVYPGAPHGLFVTHMEEVNRDILEFASA